MGTMNIEHVTADFALQTQQRREIRNRNIEH